MDPYVDLVQSWYGQFLNRPADPAGLANWVRLLRRGASPEDLEAAILGSQEYYDRKGGHPAVFIRGLYLDVLSRHARAPEVESWLSRLAEYNGDRTRIAAEFLRESQPELANRPGGAHYQLQPGIP